MFTIGFMGCALDAKGEPCGTKGVGKDTVSEMLHRKLSSYNYDCYSFSLAGPLKDLVSASYDLPRSTYDTVEVKEVPIPKYGGWSYRKFLEVIGTNVVRNELNLKEAWLDKVIWKIKHLMMSPLEKMVAQVYDLSDHELFDEYCINRFNKTFDDLFDDFQKAMALNDVPLPSFDCKSKLVTITDVRFPNEYQELKKVDAVMVQVQRTLPDMPVNNHPSNQVYAVMQPDYIIKNNGSLQDLEHQVDELYTKLIQHHDDSSSEVYV